MHITTNRRISGEVNSKREQPLRGAGILHITEIEIHDVVKLVKSIEAWHRKRRHFEQWKDCSVQHACCSGLTCLQQSAGRRSQMMCTAPRSLGNTLSEINISSCKLVECRAGISLQLSFGHLSWYSTPVSA